MKTIVITGAGGNLGTKLRRHLERQGGYELRLLDVKGGGDSAIMKADLAIWEDRWVSLVENADAVIHLAGDPRPQASWWEIERLNIDLTLNVFEAAVRQGAKRLIFASSNWVVAGHRFADIPLSHETEPRPVNAYGVSKWVGERLGRSYSERWGLSVIAFRIGYCQRDHDNQPGTHMRWGRWGQEMWLSDGDLCQGFEKAVNAPEHLRFAVLNLVSDNDGMRWDLAPARETIGYVPQDSSQPVVTDEIASTQDTARKGRALIDSTQAWLMDRRW
jgi:NAD+ dependent glucose-6-phosphate dehydrogenase